MAKYGSGAFTKIPVFLGESRVLHVARVGGVVAAQHAQEWENVVPDDGVHLRRSHVFEARPAQILVGASPGVLTLREDAALHRLPEPGGLVLFQRVQIVQTAQEEQAGDLLDYLERVGDTARPECIPDAVDLVPEFTS